MKSPSSTVVLLFALVACPCAHAQTPGQAPGAEPARATAPAKAADATAGADRLPSSLDPRVCLEFPTSAQVIMCAEKYRPRKRQA
ncbi:MAG: hypothetical protein ABI624_05135 [Casimicrobiaceae bacterium]